MGSRTRTRKDRSLLADEPTSAGSVFTELGDTALGDPALGDPALNDTVAAGPPAPSSVEPFELPRVSSKLTGTLFGRYRLLKRLAMGGMGEVHLARQESVGGFEKLLVIKRLLPHLKSERDQVKMFFDEARLQALMSDRHIVQIFDMGEVSGQYFIAMEYVHGASWRRLIDKLKESGRSLHPAHAVQLGVQVARGLSYAHNVVDANGMPLDIVHRDVNPHNLLATYDGECKIIDFGIAKSQMSLVNTEAGTIKGKFAYMSPEQAAAEKLDRRSDIFSFGICLYELLTKKNPFHRANLVVCLDAIVNQEAPPLAGERPEVAALAPVVERCLMKRREERFSDCAELADALTRLYSDGFCGEPKEPLDAFLKGLFQEEIDEHLRLLQDTGTSGMMRSPLVTSSGPSPLVTEIASGSSSPRRPRDTAERSMERAAPPTELAPPPSFSEVPDDTPTTSSLSGPRAPAESPVEPPAEARGLIDAPSRPRPRWPLALGAGAGVALGALAVAVLISFGQAEAVPKAHVAPVSAVAPPEPASVDERAVAAAAPAAAREPAAEEPTVEEPAAEGPTVEEPTVETLRDRDRGTRRRRPRRRSPSKPAMAEGARRATAPAARAAPELKPAPEKVVAGRLSVNAGGPFVIRSGGSSRTNTSTLPLLEGEARTVRIGGQGAPFEVTLKVKLRPGGVLVTVDSSPWSVVRVDNIGRGRTPVSGLSLDSGARARVDLKSPEVSEPMQITLRYVAGGG